MKYRMPDSSKKKTSIATGTGIALAIACFIVTAELLIKKVYTLNPNMHGSFFVKL